MSTYEEYGKDITSLNGQGLPNPKTLITDSWALQESRELALNIHLIVSWLLLEVVLDSNIRVSRDIFSLGPRTMFSQGMEPSDSFPGFWLSDVKTSKKSLIMLIRLCLLNGCGHAPCYPALQRILTPGYYSGIWLILWCPHTTFQQILFFLRR